MVDFVSRLIFKLPPLLRLITVLVGAVLIHLTIGTYHTFGNMLPYMASYMRTFTDPTIRIEHFMWIPTFQGCFPFAMVFGGALSLRIGPRGAAFFGCALATSGVALSYFSIKHSFLSFFVTYGLLFGCGQGIAYVTAVTTVINWAPDKVGLISGLVAAGFGISSSIFVPIQTAIVNPDNLPPSNGYFLQRDLLERVPNLFLTLAFIYAGMQLIGLTVVCDPPEVIRCSGLASLSDCVGNLRSRKSSLHRFSSVAYKPLRMQDDAITHSLKFTDGISPRRRSVSRESCSSSDDSQLLQPEELDEQDDHSMNPKEVLKSSTFYFLFAALFCCSFYSNMFYNLYKTFAETFIDDDFFLAKAFSIGSIANAFARIGWGYLTDRTSFQTAVSIATCCASALLLTMPLAIDIGKIMYLIWLIGIFICMGATHALFITAAVKCFGSKYKATNYGFLIFSTTCSGILLSIVSQFYLKQIGYTWLFLFTAIFPFLAFLITSSIQVTPQGQFIIK